jgi:hypothetical protein
MVGRAEQASLVVGGRHVQIQLAVGENVRRFRVVDSDGRSVNVEFQWPYQPTFVVADENLAVWGGLELVLIDVALWQSHEMTCREPINSVTSLDKGVFIIVCDTYVSIVSEPDWREKIVLDHDEVFIDSRWDGRHLHLTDLRGHHLEMTF